MGFEAWSRAGTRVAVELRGVRREINARSLGHGPALTLLHGFPSSSYDYAAVAPALAGRQRLLLFDFLGFGDSDKPAAHDYSLLEQTDLVEALWRRDGLRETGLVAHDYGATVALELLARQAEGRLGTRVGAVLLMNAGLDLEAYRPRLIQRLLQWPLLGPLISGLLSERAFARSFAAVFAPARRPPAAELHEHWLAVSRRGGARLAHRLIRYIGERHRHRERWERAFAECGVPLACVWGLLDPVSGAPVLAALRRRRPGLEVVELADVGHYPQLEAPERVAEAALRFFG